MRTTLAVLVAVLAVLAGCGAGGPATTDGGTATTTEATTAGPGTTGGTTTDGTPAGSTPGGTTTGGGSTTDGGSTVEDRTTTAAGEGSDGETDDRAPWPPEDGRPRVETVGGDRPDLNYSATRVLRQVERLHGLNATGDVRLSVVLPPLWIANNRTQTVDFPDEGYGIRPEGAVALQLESDAEVEVGASSGYARATNPRVEESVTVWEAEYVRQLRNESQRVVLAHEFAHVLQYQHELFGVPPRASTTDEFLVGKALREGDAVYLHEQYRERYVEGGDGGITPEDYNGTVTRPSWNVNLGNLAYYHGYRYFTRTNGSAEQRNGALANPPRTTAAILHPETAPRYPEGDPSPPRVGGWDRYGADRVGELPIRVAFRANGLAYREAAEAAKGWRHGRMVYLRQGGESGPRVVYWRTLWADEGEAAEFAAAWRSILTERLNATVEGGLLVDDGTRDRPESVVWVRQEGTTVDVVTGSDREAVLSVLDGAGIDPPTNRSAG